MGGSLWLVYKVMQQMDPTTATRKQVKIAQNQIRRRLRRKVDLTNAEMVSVGSAAIPLLLNNHALAHVQFPAVMKRNSTCLPAVRCTHIYEAGLMRRWLPTALWGPRM